MVTNPDQFMQVLNIGPVFWGKANLKILTLKVIQRIGAGHWHVCCNEVRK
jgi:hypothetical protein